MKMKLINILDIINSIYHNYNKPKISINSNSNSNISNNTFLSSDTINIIVNNNYEQLNRDNNDPKIKTITNNSNFQYLKAPQIITNKKDRALLNVELLERFLFNNKNEYYKPIIRQYGLFSCLSSNRHSKDNDDYNLLILEEKEIFEKFIQLGFEVRVCISLDFNLIKNGWGYNESQTQSRIINLYENLSILSKINNNLHISFDVFNQLDNTFILGNDILIRAAHFEPNQGYTNTIYNNHPVFINNAISRFDAVFNAAVMNDNITRKQLKIENISDYIEIIIQSRLRNLLTNKIGD